MTTLRHKHTNLGVLERRKSKVLWLDLSKIFETKSCFFLLRVGKTAVWNHHYLASSGPGHQDDHGSDHHGSDHHGSDHLGSDHHG